MRKVECPGWVGRRLERGGEVNFWGMEGHLPSPSWHASSPTALWCGRRMTLDKVSRAFSAGLSKVEQNIWKETHEHGDEEKFWRESSIESAFVITAAPESASTLAHEALTLTLTSPVHKPTGTHHRPRLGQAGPAAFAPSAFPNHPPTHTRHSALSLSPTTPSTAECSSWSS